MASPKSAKKIFDMMFRYFPKKGAAQRYDPMRPLSGRQLSEAEIIRNRLEEEAALQNLAQVRPQMQVFDEIEAARAERARRMAEHTQPTPTVDVPEDFDELGYEGMANPYGVQHEDMPGYRDPLDVDTYSEEELGFRSRGGNRGKGGKPIKRRVGDDWAGDETPDDRYDPNTRAEMGRQESAGKFQGMQRGAKAAIDRRMGQISDELIYLEQQMQSGTIDRETANKLRTELTNEFRTLERQRLGVKRGAQQRGTMDPDDAEGGPISGITAPGVPDDYERLKQEIAIAEERIQRMEERQRRIREIPERTQEDLQREIMSQADAERRDWNRPVRRVEDAFDTVTGGDTSRMGGGLDERLLRAMRFVPLERRPGEGEQPEPMPDLMRKAMGVGGQALEMLDFTDPISMGIQSAELLGPVVTGQQPLYQRLVDPEKTGALRAHREEQRQLIRQRLEERKRELYGVRP